MNSLIKFVLFAGLVFGAFCTSTQAAPAVRLRFGVGYGYPGYPNNPYVPGRYTPNYPSYVPRGYYPPRYAPRGYYQQYPMYHHNHYPYNGYHHHH